MIDETTRMDGPEEPNRSEDRVGFCQDCGQPLTRATVRAVGSGMFCEPCLEARVNATPGAGPAYGSRPGAVPPQETYTPPPSGSSAGAPPRVPGEPSPTLAALLGMIPGVGAMYNGQYAKGGVHFLVFIVLMSLSDHVSSIFGLVVVGWWFYMVMDAYHTARARRDGLPLPDPFGFNDIGERLGFNKNWGVSSSARSGNAGWSAPQPPPNVPPAGSYTTNAYVPPVAPPTSGPDWVGYVPPTAFGGPGPVNPYAVPPVPPAAEPQTQSEQPRAHWGQPSYAETFTGNIVDNTLNNAMHAIPEVPARRFPVGALWLIVLGALFLMSNWMPFWRINGSATVAVLLAGLAVWIFVRRMGYAGGLHYSGNIVCSLRGPVVLMTMAIIFGLQSLHIATFAEAWPLLLVTSGVILLLERTIGNGPVYIPPANPGYVPPVSGGAPGTFTPGSDQGQSNFGKGGL